MGEQHLDRVQPGGSFIGAYSAKAFNIFAESAEEVARLRRLLAAGGPPQKGPGRNTGVVTIRNDTGGDLDRFAIVGLGDPIIDNRIGRAHV